jgi:Secretion system C-terminal sorting domain
MKQFLLALVFLLLGAFTALHAQSAGSKQQPLSVYPNPAIDYIFVKDANRDDISNLFVFNLVGKRVKEFDYQKGERYYVGDLPKGMFLVQIIDKDKRIITTQKIDKRQ